MKEWKCVLRFLLATDAGASRFSRSIKKVLPDPTPPQMYKPCNPHR
jgi:hypothetical protein